MARYVNSHYKQVSEIREEREIRKRVTFIHSQLHSASHCISSALASFNTVTDKSTPTKLRKLQHPKKNHKDQYHDGSMDLIIRIRIEQEIGDVLTENHNTFMLIRKTFIIY